MRCTKKVNQVLRFFLSVKSMAISMTKYLLQVLFALRQVQEQFCPTELEVSEWIDE